MTDMLDTFDDDELIGLRDQLLGALAPEVGFEDRIEQRIRQRLLDRETAGLFMDLLGLGVRSAGAILSPPDRAEPPEPDQGRKQ
jgi:hypothetical protein